MTKKLLFIMNSMECGGAEKSLISLLETIDYSRFEVDLFLFKHKGDFLECIPKKVRLLPESADFRFFEQPIWISLKQLAKDLNISVIIKRLKAGLIFKTVKVSSVAEQRVWKYAKSVLGKLNNEYDVAIGFLERGPIYFCIDNVKSKKKIGWIHTDYNKLNVNEKLDKKYLDKLDSIITISQDCKEVLDKRFPQYINKTKVIRNIVSSETIRRLSAESVEFNNFNLGDIKIISVGRVEPEKGYDIAVEACKELRDRGYPVKWYIIGDGTLRAPLEKIINELGLDNHFHILGIKHNPYAYMKKCDIYVQPSKYEGRSIAIDEAKIMNMPIVVTNFNTAKFQINNNENGIITDLNKNALADGIEKMINDVSLNNRLRKNLEKERVSNEDEIKKFYALIE